MLTATYQATTTIVGSGVGVGAGPFLQDSAQTAPQNMNAPPPTSFTLANGANTIPMPASSAGFTFTRVQIMPPASSALNKYITTSGGARVLPANSSNFWTTGSITLPVGPSDTAVYVNSAGIETLELAFS